MGRCSDYDGDDAIPEAVWFSRLSRASTGKAAIKRFREMGSILDAMPAKRLITEALVKAGDVCFVGAICQAKGVKMWEGDCDIFDTANAGKRAGIPWTLAWTMADKNDEAWRKLTPEERWVAAREWVAKELAEAERHQSQAEPRPQTRTSSTTHSQEGKATT